MQIVSFAWNVKACLLGNIICMKYQSLFSWRYKKNTTKLSSAELAQEVIRLNCLVICEYWAYVVQIQKAGFCYDITKTCLFNYTENFTTKQWKFSDKKMIFLMFLLKT